MCNRELWAKIVGVMLLALTLAGCIRAIPSLVSKSAATTSGVANAVLQATAELSVSNANQITETARLQGHQNGINAVIFSPDGSMLASGDASSSIRLWDVKQKKELTEFEGPTGHVADMVFHPDGTTIIAITTNWLDEADFHKLRLWNVQTYNEVFALAKIGEMNAEDVRPASALAISPDGKQLAMNTCSGPVSMSGGNLICQFNGVRLFDIDDENATTALPQTFEATVREMAFSPDGTQLVAVGSDGTARLFTVKGPTEKFLLLRSEAYAALSTAFGPDGKTVAVALGDGTIHLFDVMTGKELQILKGHTEPVLTVAFNPDGTLLASAGTDKTIRLWNVATGETVTMLQGHSEYVLRAYPNKPAARKAMRPQAKCKKAM